nr:MAG TPA: hypothetical protein [Caudoviricetes sp.]
MRLGFPSTQSGQMVLLRSFVLLSPTSGKLIKEPSQGSVGFCENHPTECQL